jgi:folate-binding protein YgfZ
VLVPLDSHVLIRASGADASTFLQGQLSSDLRLLSPARAQLSSVNSPKGRMQAVLLLLRLGEAIGIEVHQSLAQDTLARLRKFVMRSKLTLELLPAPSGLGLVGPDVEAWLRERSLPVPAQAFDCASAGDVTVLRRAGDEPRFSLHGALDAFASEPARDVGEWRRAELFAGVPIVYPQTVDHFIPQMANLDRLGGVSFDKGCYTGQEIVARLHFLGTLKRRMFLCTSVDDPGGPGTAVYDATGDGQAVGEIVDAVPTSDGFAAAVVLQLAHAESTKLHAGSTNGAALSTPRDFS